MGCSSDHQARRVGDADVQRARLGVHVRDVELANEDQRRDLDLVKPRRIEPIRPYGSTDLTTPTSATSNSLLLLPPLPAPHQCVTSS